MPVEVVVAKLEEASGTDAVDLIKSGEINIVVNTPRGRGPRADGAHIRAAAGSKGIPLLTTVSSAIAAANGIADWRTHRFQVRTLQEFHAGVSRNDLADR